MALLAPLVAVGVVLAIAVRRSDFTLSQYLFYGYGRLMARILWRGEFDRPLPIPSGQGAVIVCNHRSPFDPAFIQLATDRVVHWMVAREFCEHPLLAWFFRLPQAIPVGRGGVDTAATKLAIRYASQGDLVGMLPEGRLNLTDELLLSGRPGAVLVALKARVPIIPCYVENSPIGRSIWASLVKPAHTRLWVGDPIDLSDFYEREGDREVLDELTIQVMREIAHLAGRDDFEPTIAGRRWKPTKKAALL